MLANRVVRSLARRSVLTGRSTRFVPFTTVPKAAFATAPNSGGAIESKVKELGLEIPQPSTPKGNYVPVMRSGNMLYTAGHLPIEKDGTIRKGKVGKDVSVDEAYDAAQLVTMNLLATLKKEVGDLDRVKRVVKLTGFVNCVDEFAQQPQVINGASDLIGKIFGDKGIHSRSAVGTNALPLNIPVEIEAIVEVEE